MNKANKEERKKSVVVEGVLIVVVRRRPAPYANNSNQLYKSRERATERLQKPSQ